MALPTYASPLERVWYYTFRGLCALIFLFLIAPILVIIPLSFNADSFFTFSKGMLHLDPAAYSMKWYDLLLTFPDVPLDVPRDGLIHGAIVQVVPAN